jgi:eukaryotic-like serine/threonine-protein kinase
MLINTKEERILNDFYRKICPGEIDDPKFSSYYEQYDQRIRDIFSMWHGHITRLVDFMNSKAKVNHHFNAEESRILLNTIEQIEELLHHLKESQYRFEVVSDIKNSLKYFSTFLELSGGSHIPDDYQKIEISKYEPIFFIINSVVKIKNNQNLNLQIVGEGAFAIVSKYEDPDYQIYFAVKQLKKTTTEREESRFKEEYKILSSLKSPYILQVYRFEDDKQRYIMEYCDDTLYGYYMKNSNTIPFFTRKRIAQQFLYGIIYLHHKNILHRDLSNHNILLKTYDSGVISVKLSDFGLVKLEGSGFTKTDTELKGTIIDPSLESFKSYSIENEIYAIGIILKYIFTGKKNFSLSNGSKLEVIVDHCISSNLSKQPQAHAVGHYL